MLHWDISGKNTWVPGRPPHPAPHLLPDLQGAGESGQEQSWALIRDESCAACGGLGAAILKHTGRVAGSGHTSPPRLLNVTLFSFLALKDFDWKQPYNP